MSAQLKFLAEEKCERIQKLVDDLKAHYQARFSGPQYWLGLRLSMSSSTIV